MYNGQNLYQEELDYINQLKLPWEKLNNSTILVTGASGMIGTFLIDVLVKRNQRYGSNVKILALSRTKEKLEERFFQFGEVTIIAQDVCDPIEYKSGIDYIIHAACDSQPMLRYKYPVDIMKTSIIGMDNLCSLALQKKVKKTILLSTIGVHGEHTNECECFAEEDMGYVDCWSYKSAYNEGKRATETIASSYVHQYDLDLTAIRLCKTFGSTCHDEDGLVPTQFMLKAVAGEDIIMKSSGNQIYSFAYLPDAVSGILYVLLKGEKGEVYELGDGMEENPVSLKQYVGYLEGQFPIHVIYENMGEQDNNLYTKSDRSVSKSTKLYSLGWTKKYSIKEGLFRSVTIRKDKEYILVGATIFISQIMDVFEEQHKKIRFICDNDIRKQGKKIRGYDVYPVDIIKQYPFSDVVITSSKFDVIYKQLSKMNIPNNILMTPYQYYRGFDYDLEYGKKFFSEKAKELSQLYEIQDSYTGKLLDLIVSERLHGKESLASIYKYKEFAEVPEYFYDDALNPDGDITWIDIGAYTGDTILSGYKHFGHRMKKIYAFEPDSNNFQIMQCILKENNIESCSMEVGIGLKDEKLQMSMAGKATKVGTDGGETIQIRNIDSLKLDIIGSVLLKMDIEGFELDALMGAKEFIQSYKPYLAVCVYHKIDDIYKIPQCIKEICPEYKFYLRAGCHTECYAIPTK